jgi:hypothetical protein
MANLTVTITEEILLPNKNFEKMSNQKIISGVNQITRRVDTIATSFSGSGIELVRFVDSEQQQTAGSFVRDTVKYIRITNLDTTNSCDVYLIRTSLEEIALPLDAGKSIMLPNAYLDSSTSVDFVSGDYVDLTYLSDMSTLDVIKAKASGSSVQLEYVVASS